MLCELMLLVLSGIAWLWVCCSVFLDVAMNSGDFGWLVWISWGVDFDFWFGFGCWFDFLWVGAI